MPAQDGGAGGDGRGGGLYLASGSLTLNNVSVSNNIARGGAGGVGGAGGSGGSFRSAVNGGNGAYGGNGGPPKEPRFMSPAVR